MGKWNQGETIDQAFVRKENGDIPSIGGRFRIPTSSREARNTLDSISEAGRKI